MITDEKFPSRNEMKTEAIEYISILRARLRKEYGYSLDARLAMRPSEIVRFLGMSNEEISQQMEKYRHRH